MLNSVLRRRINIPFCILNEIIGNPVVLGAATARDCLKRSNAR